MSVLESKEIMQVALAVKNIEAAAGNYARIFGIEMPGIRNVFPTFNYRGVQIQSKARICAFKMGGVTLELVEPDETSTSWKEYLDQHGEGVHHLGFLVKDRAAALQVLSENGIEKRQYGGANWGSYTFMDSEEKLGVVISIKNDDPFTE